MNSDKSLPAAFSTTAELLCPSPIQNTHNRPTFIHYTLTHTHVSWDKQHAHGVEWGTVY